MKKAGCLICSDANLKRRYFLKAGSLSLLGMGAGQYLGLQSALAARGEQTGKKAQACILMFLEGGPSQLDTWDPKPSSGFKPISTNVPGIQISELLPRVAKHMDKISIIRSMHTEEIDHPEATHYLATGHRPNPAMRFPSIGSVISKEMGPRNGLPAYVLQPQWEVQRENENFFKAAFIGPEYDPMVVPDPSKEDFAVPDLTLPKSMSVERIEDRRGFLNIVDRLFREKEEMAEYANMDSFTDQALQLILSPNVKKAFDMSQESEKTKERYGKTGFGQSVLLSRRLVEAGCRFVTAAGYKYNAWDAHKENDKNHREVLVPPFDQAMSALLKDLDQRGLLESTVVIALGEFGRTPHINPNNGRDHWPHCWSLALGGGGIRGGQVVGASDDRGAYVADRMVTMGDVFATIYKAFGIDWTKTYMTPIGRPIKIANSINDKTGEPLDELV